MSTPPGWSPTDIRSVTSDISYGYTASASTDPVGPRLLRITDIQDDTVDWSTVPYCECSDLERYGIRTDDIVVARTGATTGKSYLIAGDVSDSVFASYLIRLRANAAIAPGFLAWFMRSPRYWGQITSVSKGTAQPGANATLLGEVTLDLAPLNEQRRIVAKLDAVFEQTRAAKARLERLPALLEKLKRSILGAAYRGDLTKDWRAAHPDVEPASVLLDRISTARRRRWEEALRTKGKAPKNATYDEAEAVNAAALPELPTGWAWASADALTAAGRPIRYGIVKPGPHVADGVPYVRISEMVGGTVNIADVKRCAPERAKLFEGAALRTGDILVSKDGTIGRVAIVPPELDGGNITQHVLRISPSSEIDGRFLATIIETPQCYRWMTGELRGMGLQGVNVGDFRRMPIPVPPRDEQLHLVQRVVQTLRELHTLAAKCSQQLIRWQTFEAGVLQAAFRGSLVPQDPADEPASILLDRIRAARTAEPHPPKRVRGRRRDDTVTEAAASAASSNHVPTGNHDESLDLVVGMFQIGRRLTMTAITEGTGLDLSTVRTALEFLVAGGQVRVRRATYEWSA